MNTPPYCILPWISLHARADGTVYPCCYGPGTTPIANLNSSTMEEIWDSQKMRDVRLSLRDGVIPPSCARCERFDKAGSASQRRTLTKYFAHCSDKILHMADDGSTPFDIRFIDFRFDNICNLKCRFCSEAASSSAAAEKKKLGVLNGPTILELSNINGFNESLNAILPTVELIQFNGGEALLSEKHYDILDWLIASNRTDVFIRYTTNLSTLEYKNRHILDYWSKFPNIHVTASIDGTGQRAEYIRHGCRWDEFVKNVNMVQSSITHAEFSLCSTMCAYTAHSMIDDFNWWVDNGHISPDQFLINLLDYPSYFHARVLPESFRQLLHKSFLDHIEKITPSVSNYILSRWIGAANYLVGPQNEQHLAEFKKTTSNLDLIRGESFANTFPELARIL